MRVLNVLLLLGGLAVFNSQAAPADELLSLRERAQVQDNLLAKRVEHLLPRLMARSGIDMWLMISRPRALAMICLG